MNALSLYLTTTRMVFQPTLHVDDSASWADINRLLVYLRQALTCCVCGCLLQVPMSSTISSCQHHVCKSCIGGKMRLKPSCSFCKDQSKFIENTQLRILLQSYKELCDYISVAGVLEKWGGLSSNGIVTQTNGNQGSSSSQSNGNQGSSSSAALLGPANLLQLIEEGQSYSDRYKFSEPPLATAPSLKSRSPKSPMKGSKLSETQVSHPSNETQVSHPLSQTQVSHPSNDTQVSHPSNDTQVSHPSNETQVSHPSNETQVSHPSNETQVGHSLSVKSEPVQSKDAALILDQSSVSDGKESIPPIGKKMSTTNGSIQNASSDAVKKFKPIEKKARMSRTVIPQPITATVLVDATPTLGSQQIHNPIVQDQEYQNPIVQDQKYQNPIVQDQECSTVSNPRDLDQDFDDLNSQTIQIQVPKEETIYKSQTVYPQFDSSHSASTVSNMVQKQTAQYQHQQPTVSLATVSLPSATLVQVRNGQPQIVPITKTQMPTAPKPLVQSTMSQRPLVQSSLTTMSQKPLVQSSPTTVSQKPLVQSTMSQKPLVQSTMSQKPLVQSSPSTVGPNPPPSPGKSKSKRRGCRCGLATPTPGKLTCCGQRCPCYVDGKGCYDCKCRGCRNPHHANTTPGIMVTPAVKPAPGGATTATIKTILAGQSVPVTKSFGGDSVQTCVQVRPITTIGSCQLVPIPSSGSRNPHIMVSQKAPNPNSHSFLSSIASNSSLTLTSASSIASNSLTLTSADSIASNPLTLTSASSIASNPLTLTSADSIASNPLTLTSADSIASNPLTLTSADPTPSTFSFFPMTLKGQPSSSHSPFHSSDQPIMVSTHPTLTSQPMVMVSQSSINQTNQTTDQTGSFNEPLTLPLTMDDLTIGSNDDDPTKMAESNFMIDDHISMM